MNTNFASALVVASVMVGCASSASHWESSFGDAARQARTAQLIDPDAAKRNSGPTSGLDGKAAAGAMRAYAESYGYAVKEVKQPALAISTTGNR